MMLFKGKTPLLSLLQEFHHVQDVDWFSSLCLWNSHHIFKFQSLSPNLCGSLTMICLLLSLEQGKAKWGCQWVPHVHLQFPQFARRADWTQHTVVLMALIYFGERIQRKISNGKRWKGPSVGKSRCRFPGVLSGRVIQDMLKSPSNKLWQHVWSDVN